jgi:hypothetical protein
MSFSVAILRVRQAKDSLDPRENRPVFLKVLLLSEWLCKYKYIARQPPGRKPEQSTFVVYLRSRPKHVLGRRGSCPLFLAAVGFQKREKLRGRVD